MSTDERRSDAGITGPRHAFEDEPQPQEPEYEGEGEKDDGELPGDYDDSIGPFPQEPAPGSPEAVKAAAETPSGWFERNAVSPEEALADGASQVLTWAAFEAELIDDEPREALREQRDELQAEVERLKHDGEAWERAAKLMADKAEERIAEVAALKEELERQSTAAGTLSDLIEKRAEERDALGDALKDLYLSCRKWAPTIDRARAEAILRKIGRLA